MIDLQIILKLSSSGKRLDDLYSHFQQDTDSHARVRDSFQGKIYSLYQSLLSHRIERPLSFQGMVDAYTLLCGSNLAVAVVVLC